VDRKVHIGKVIGQYQYAANIEPAYPHHRSVEWIKVVPRTSLSQGFLYTIGSAMSFFRADGYSEEFLAVLKGAKTAAPPPEDPTLQIVAQEIEQTTRDFLLKQFSRELRGHPFAEFVAHVLELMGYRTRVSPPGIDGGIDIVAHKDELGFEPPIIKVQVKSSDSSIGAPEVQALYGNVNAANGEFGLFVALGGFTLPAQTFAKSKSNLRLINSEEFVDLVLQNYERLDSRYKGLLPLKHVYVPEPLTDSAESES
jgi:restriction system protein